MMINQPIRSIRKFVYVRKIEDPELPSEISDNYF